MAVPLHSQGLWEAGRAAGREAGMWKAGRAAGMWEAGMAALLCQERVEVSQHLCGARGV